MAKLTRGRGGRRRDAAGSAARSDGDGVAELVDQSLGWSSGLRISTGRRAVVLWTHHGGQGGAGLTDGEKSSGRGKTHRR